MNSKKARVDRVTGYAKGTLQRRTPLQAAPGIEGGSPVERRHVSPDAPFVIVRLEADRPCEKEFLYADGTDRHDMSNAFETEL